MKKRTIVIGLSFGVLLLLLAGCTRETDESNIYQIHTGNFWEYEDINYEVSPPETLVTHREVISTKNVSVNGEERLYFELAWLTDVAQGEYLYSLLYDVVEGDGMYWDGGISAIDTFVRRSLYLPDSLYEGLQWETLFKSYSQTDTLFYVSDTVQMAVTNADTVLTTPLGDIHCVEISYDFWDSAKRSLAVMRDDWGRVVADNRQRAMGEVHIKVYYAQGYGFVGYTESQNGTVLYTKRIRRIEQKLH